MKQRTGTIILSILLIVVCAACRLSAVPPRAPEPSPAPVAQATEAESPRAEEAPSAPVTPSPRHPVTPSQMGVTSRERLVWPAGTYPVGVATDHPYGLTFTVREMRIEEDGLVVAWEATNHADRALELKSKYGEPPLLQDNTGRVYEYPDWPEGEVLAVEPGERVEGEWRFSLPAFDAYRMRLGVNLIRAVASIGVPGSQPSFWTPAWELPNPDWPRREEASTLENVAEATVDGLTVAISEAEFAVDRLILHLVASLEPGDIQETVTLGWTSLPRLEGARRYVLDRWSWEGQDERLGRPGAVLPGQTWEGVLVFYPAPQSGEKLTLTLNPKPVLRSEPTVALAFVAP